MAKQFRLEITTPEGSIYNDQVEEITIPTLNGEITILADHENLVSDVAIGEMRIFKDGKSDSVAVGSGFIKVTKGQVMILTDLASFSQNIVEAEVEKSRQAAEAALKEKVLSDEEYAVAAANLQKALAQLKVKRRHHR